MDKIYTTTNTQLRKLRSRGLIIKNGSRAKSIIEKENYYNLINGYKKLFLDKTYTGTDEKYLPGTNFNEIYALYLFDRELRNIYIKHILEIENNVKSILSHDFSKKYSHDNYLKITNFNTTVPPRSSKTQSQKHGEIAELISFLQKEISHQLKKNSNMISHYVLNYGYVPFWVLVNTLSLGTVSTFYSLLKPKDQNDIGRKFNLKPDELSTILFILSIFRNACAHDELFFNLKSIKKDNSQNSIKDTPVHSALKIPKNNSNNYIYGKNDLFAITIIFKLMLNRSSFNKFVASVKQQIDHLGKELKTISINEVLAEMGFPTNWQQIQKV